MTDDQQELLDEAQDSIDAAKLLLENGFAGYAASRAYYAMLYIAECLLEGESLSFSKHSAVIAAFGQYFARTGRVSTEFHRYLIEGQALRQTGDYGQRHAVTVAQAETQIERAQQFIALAKQIIGTRFADNE